MNDVSELELQAAKAMIEKPEGRLDAAIAAQTLVKLCHTLSAGAGWWSNVDREDTKEKVVKLALIHSEVSEAFEGVRKNNFDDHISSRRAEEVELADVLIRVFDYAGGFGLDIAGAMVEKLLYNQTREDHKQEARASENGKKF